jgi:hypothetical protein
LSVFLVLASHHLICCFVWLAYGGCGQLGEFVEVLRCFGVSDEDPLLRAGLAFLLASQDEDGTWDTGKDAYTVYHATMVRAQLESRVSLAFTERDREYFGEFFKQCSPYCNPFGDLVLCRSLHVFLYSFKRIFVLIFRLNIFRSFISFAFFFPIWNNNHLFSVNEQVGIQALLCHSYRGYGPGITSVSALMAQWANADGNLGSAAVGIYSRAGRGWTPQDASEQAAACLECAAAQLGFDSKAFQEAGQEVEALYGNQWFEASVAGVLPKGKGLRVS